MNRYFWQLAVSVFSLLALYGPQGALGEGLSLEQYDELVTPLLEKMTLAEKIGQMTQAELSALTRKEDIRDLALGSVLSGGGSDPEAGNSLAAWTDAYDACQEQALATRLQIPLLYGIDAVHGHNNVLGAVVFPHNIALGCTRDPDLVREIGRITALEVRATGINWTFAPCVTVPRDDRWGRTFEGFSESPELVAQLGAASVEGLQGALPIDAEHILACAKHFVGDGGTSPVLEHHPDWEGFGDQAKLMLDQGDTRCDEATLRKIHLATYIPAIRAGVGTIMPSYNSWNGVKCTGNKHLLTDVLKDELQFEGFLISDYNAIDQVNDDYKTAIGMSINAGIDMAMVPTKYREFISLLTRLVDEGTVSKARIDEAVRRILRVKAAMGLLDPHSSHLADRKLQEEFGSPLHREVARQAVQKSLVLLKNENQTLPIEPSIKRVCVVGQAADDIGVQCGGWTIEWQGQAGQVTTGGTTILAGLRQVAPAGTEITFDAAGNNLSGSDLAVVVVGEQPYAEGMGDNFELTPSADDVELIRRAEQSGVPTVVVLLSGRPLIVNEALDRADAFVAAWLPGTEGAGVADILFGKARPTGKLSFSWPRSAEQHPINVGDADYEPLFAFGYGLTYQLGE